MNSKSSGKENDLLKQKLLH